jgi:hypothetical protein
MKLKTASVEQIKATRLITAIKTPYLPNGKVDLAAYDALVGKGWTLFCIFRATLHLLCSYNTD